MLSTWRSEKKAAKKAEKKRDIVAAGAEAEDTTTSDGAAAEDAHTGQARAHAGQAAGVAGGSPRYGESEDGTEAVEELAGMRSPVTRLQKTYMPAISYSTGHPIVTLHAAVLVLDGTGAMIPQLKTELFGDTGQDSLQVAQTFDPGTDLDEASDQAEKVEEILADDGDVD